MFPLSVVRRLTFEASEPEALALRLRKVLAGELLRKRARVEVCADTVTFIAGIFRFVSSGNLLGVIGYGSVRIAAETDSILVEYRLHFLEIILLSALVVTFMATVMRAGGLPLQSAIGGGLFFFTFISFGNIFVALARFRNFVNKCVRAAKEGGELTS
ncbi:hypothetical protein LCGC14_3092280 [marine sediment metagenome]|uniref:Uncharacterized protein n=1 Tax=marine sediment metagenome TaxID=412755 RepID=A0A0F8WA52_9ZZZZ